MLKDILKIINRDGYISRNKISKELGVHEDLIDEGINQLVKMGYLLQEKTGENCSTVCSLCPYARNCGKEIVKTFKILEKGHRYFDNSSHKF